MTLDPATEYLVGCIPLAAGETLRIEDPRAVLVHVAQGRVWITEEGLADDIVRDEGAWFRLTRRGVGLVQALAPAVVVLASPHVHAAASITTVPRPGRRVRSVLRPQRGPSPSGGGQGLALATAARR